MVLTVYPLGSKVGGNLYYHFESWFKHKMSGAAANLVVKLGGSVCFACIRELTYTAVIVANVKSRPSTK